MRHQSRVRSRSLLGAAAVLATTALLVSACGGTKAGQAGKKASTAGLSASDGESGLKDAGSPKRGGKLIYGVEADTSGGFCLPEGQLAISGMLVVRAVYDTLTVPDSKGDYVPYLAKSLSHSADYKTWTINLRSGIKFSDGSDLTATVVKNNLDAYRGTYPGRSPLLFKFVFGNIADTKVTGPLSVQVDMTKPWVAFPAYLFSSSRLGIMGQKQLDDKTHCGTDLVGTGPFTFKSYTPNQKLDAVRNPHYWQIAPDGKPYPYADSIEFRILPDGTARDQALESGTINLMHTSDAEDISGALKDLRDQGKANMFVSENSAEISFIQLNATKPPFNDLRMRQALAMGADRSAINQEQNNGLPTVADGPFAPDSVAYLKDPGFPKFDVAKAKALVASYEKDTGKKASFNLSTTTDPSTLQLAELIQQKAQAMGVTVKLVQRDQAALINDAIGKAYQAMVFRNFPGGDPDINYVWWYGKGNPVNFSGFDDPVINKDLDAGRSETDPAKRKADYQDINREFAKKVWNIWAWYTPWAVVESPHVHGILGPPLPGADTSKPGPASTTDPTREPSTGMAFAHSLLGLWIDN